MYFRRAFALSTIFLGSVACHPSLAQDRVCSAIRKGLDGTHIVGPSYDDQDVWRTSDFDFDGDGRNDQMVLQCENGTEFIPADPCSLTINLATGRVLHLASPKMMIERFNDHPYIIASDPMELPHVMRLNITVYAVRSGALRKVCAGIVKDIETSR
jgi:hypothetical protein